MAFIETRFPLSLVPGASGGPQWSTEIVAVRSGYEVRNVNWSLNRRRFNAALGVKTLADVETLLAWFNAMQGRAHGFRYKDWSDFKSCAVQATVANTDQLIGVGDSSNRVFQLVKKYTAGAQSYTHTIKKPVSGTTVVAVNGVSSANWAVDTTTGIVTFTPGNAPPTGQNVTAGFEYDVPCRFDTDALDVSLITALLTESEVPVVEIRV